MLELGWVKSLKILFFIVDIGFIIYWGVTLLHLIPNEYLFEDYHNPLLTSWNWSFFPLDILISITGFNTIRLLKKGNALWEKYALISLTLTFCSGLMAIAFWGFRNEFQIQWWLPNLFLMLYPLFFIFKILNKKD